MAENWKSFTGQSPGEARSAASDWLRNFKEHGPLEIRSLRVSGNDERFTATVTYSEMTVEATPQHFPNYEPVLKSA
jgi:hypothetical protein